MINNLNVLAVIPARGGSKGVLLKNLRKVAGVPIVELAARVANEVDIIDKVVVSTDHEGIAKSAIDGGARAPFRRPKSLSGDRISDVQVLTHAVKEMEKQDKKQYGIIVMLQPTSPLRVKKDVIDSIKMLVKNNFNAVWTVSETDSKSHPLKQLIVKNGSLDYYDKDGKNIIARQQLEPVYHRNGIAYVITRDCLLNEKSIMGNNTGALLCQDETISIDTEFDFILADFFLKKNEKDAKNTTNSKG
jgi:CMP-N,N'-diacetyllegionaminic acid synthase